MGVIPTRGGVRKLLREARFAELAEPRQMWIDYLRGRISEPGEVRAGKQGLARWLNRQEWVFTNPVTRLLLDVGMGSNFFIARKQA